MTPPTIEWTQQRYSERGTITKPDGTELALWSVSYDGITRRRETPWHLQCELPGIKRDVYVASVAEAKVRAQRQLRTFLGFFGGEVERSPCEFQAQPQGWLCTTHDEMVFVSVEHPLGEAPDKCGAGS